MSIRLVNYSEKAIAVYGDTKEHKERLLSLGGKFNQNLKEGPGWIFSKKNESSVKQYVDSAGTSKKAVVTQARALDIPNIRDIIAKIPCENRLAFIAEVSRLALEVPYKGQESVSTKRENSEDEDSDIEDDDPTVPMSRMLV